MAHTMVAVQSEPWSGGVWLCFEEALKKLFETERVEPPLSSLAWPDPRRKREGLVARLYPYS